MTPPTLAVLAEHRQALLQAELGALLHNVGKLSDEFIRTQDREATKQDPFSYRAIVGIVAILLKDAVARSGLSEQEFTTSFLTGRSGLPSHLKPSKLTAKLLDESVREWLQRRDVSLPVPFVQDEHSAVGDFIEFQHSRWYEDRSPLAVSGFLRSPWATWLLQRSHHGASGVEKAGDHFKKQAYASAAIASAFGHEHAIPRADDFRNMAQRRDELLAAVMAYAEWVRNIPADAGADPVTEIVRRRNAMLETAVGALGWGLGDTQWPINDVTTWDLGASAAALFKAGAARFILSPPEPIGREVMEALQWRFLGIRLDGMGFLSQAHHITDLLGRQRALRDALDRARDVLEVRYPLANEVYRDENGSVFIAPDLPNLLALPVSDAPGAHSLDEALAAAFDGTGPSDLQGEVDIDFDLSLPCAGHDLVLGDAIRSLPHLSARPARVAEWWKGQGFPQNCTVCQLRPQGSGAAGRRNICETCFQRRERRSEAWFEQKQDTTSIWTDEVADINGRLALVTGRFDLDGWLGGALVGTLSVGSNDAGVIGKSASFARIRRIFETTEVFWEDIGHQLDQAAPRVGYRLRIDGRWGDTGGPALTAYGAYEMRLGVIGVGVVWDPKGGPGREGAFTTTSNLGYLARQLGANADVWRLDDQTSNQRAAAWIVNHLRHAGPLTVQEHGGYNAPASVVGAFLATEIEPEEHRFIPAIPLLTEPRQFMAVVPASNAMRLIDLIDRTYDERLNRVRNRLRLDLGVIFFPRRTPIPAVVDAGRRMLDMPLDWQRWTVASVQHSATAREHVVSFEEHDVTWRFPSHMDVDTAQPDDWYPIFQIAEGDAPRDSFSSQCHVRSLEKGQRVLVRPSRLDFEFLDSSARRLRLGYTCAGRRDDPERRHRPYLLDQVTTLHDIWRALPREPGGRLATTQVHHLIHLVESRRRDWSEPLDTGHSAVFQRFVADAVAQMDTEGWWHRLTADTRALLVRAATRGWLSDVLELNGLSPFPWANDADATHEEPITT